MTRSITVLVTGVGGDFGQALTKALRIAASPMRIVGCDMDAAGIGSAFVDEYADVPPARNAAGYVEAIDALCRRLAVEAVVPGSEVEINVLGALGSPPRLPSGAAVVCQRSDWVDTYGDKLNCMRALNAAVPVAPFADGLDRNAVEKLIGADGFPLVVKPRRASGSRFIRIVNDTDALAAALSQVPGPIVQGYLPDVGGEFSVGLFACPAFTAEIAFKRALGPVGCSWYAETTDDADVLAYARTVTRASGLQGAANLQVRKTARGVRLLEINARFSSLAAARALCGFRDVEWSVGLALGWRVGPPPLSYSQCRFRRFFHELVDSGSGYRAVPEWLPKIDRGCLTHE
jgi:biotin carboxylase